ncbi:phosphatase PAP2 family protein [Sphingomonas solaris]|uniref:Phosphatase PAP2 family protein n=2 Tax=Alterirhizorhabdus solaris TaxID=2529389 RepID=A0A558R4Z3_9SPHN|nr:phosphatase PAP2 family protein [Sphingomonas solaris]
MNKLIQPRRAALAAILLLAGSPACASPHGWGKASGIVRDVLVGAALGVPAVQGDWQGDLQAAGSLVATGGTTYALKELIHERRPDGSDRKSFPSGHASIAFAAAGTLENRYGWQAGLPAFVLASFVGVARVEARRHHWYDAVAGAALGTGTAFAITRQRDSDVRLVPWADGGGGGLSLAARF